MRLNVVMTPPRPEGSGHQARGRLMAAARSLEAAGVTALVLDRPAPTDHPRGVPAFEAVTLAALLARTTSRIGLVAADSALFGYPYNTARRLASLDHLSGGRSGWRPVTSPDDGDEAVYGLAVGGPDEQRSRAAEFVEVVLALWDTWEPGAELPDRAAGNFRDDTQIHPIDHRSTYYRVHGPLDVPRCPQGRPVIVRAVRTPDELAMAARFADVVEPWCANEAELAETVTAVRAAAGRAGRSPTELLVLPALGWRAGPEVVSIGERDLSQRLGEVVTSAGADGATLVGPGTPEWAEALAGDVLPALRGLLARPRAGATLAENYGLRRSTETDRSVA